MEPWNAHASIDNDKTRARGEPFTAPSTPNEPPQSSAQRLASSIPGRARTQEASKHPQPMELEQLTAAFREKVTVRNVSRVAAAAAVSNLADQLAAATALDEPEEAESEEVCTLRVRFPDGRVIRKRFGAKRPAAALFRFCHSVITAEGGGAGATARRTFRLVRLAGGASVEIHRADASFEQLGLHRSTIYVVFSV